ncbi:hypothetical protein LCGC14_0659510 [marine sediment metagenome]|uniref:Transposase putative helix-turn-helix domain-containing protein n=1 Tax=marine sediment metagenome TaxID=412755 RepID=A0A0F9QU34_9ZZZZ|nr:hypothetical protein [bacterium]
MRLTEIIHVKPSEHLTNLCHLAKNLYNLGNWYIKRDFFNLNNILSYYDLDFMVKRKNAYRNLPSQTSQQLFKLLMKNWRSYFKAIQDYRKNPQKYKKKPKIPRYKKKNGESIVIFTNQQCKIKDGNLHFPKRVNLEQIRTIIKEKLKEVRIIPLGINYKIEIVYEKEEKDLGLNNLIKIVLFKGVISR